MITGLNTWLKRHSLLVLLAGLGCCLLGVGMMVGMFATLSFQASPASDAAMAELPLFATATDTGESMSMATGPVDDEMEGVFFLDFVTGTLSAAVINSRTGKLGGVFKTNVIKDIGVEEAKKPSYLMTTGAANFVGFKRGSQEPANTVVYVCDENTGKFVAYSFMWDRTLASRGALQSGTFARLHVDNARTVQLEE